VDDSGFTVLGISASIFGSRWFKSSRHNHEVLLSRKVLCTLQPSELTKTEEQRAEALGQRGFCFPNPPPEIVVIQGSGDAGR
jgi:hypothetical protein